MYEERAYRAYCSTSLKEFQIVNQESDLSIYYSDKIDNVALYLEAARGIIKNQIVTEDGFQSSLIPLLPHEKDADLIKHMKKCAMTCEVGPMASVAGAVAQHLADQLGPINSDLIIENGGDVFIKTTEIRNILIHAGDSQLSNLLSIEIHPEKSPLGICTSSGKMGHSLSFGNSDAVVVISHDILLADALATAIGNVIQSTSDIDKGLSIAKSIKNIIGIVIIIDNTIGVWGDITLNKTRGEL